MVFFIDMIEKIFYQSSLPRAGSTLLQNVLMQNPEIYSTPTDGVLNLILASRASFNTSPEFKAQDSSQMEKAFIKFCQGGIHAFYGSLTNRKYVISKNRAFNVMYDLMNLITPRPKMICMVRDLREVIGSMEGNYRKNPTYHDHMVDFAKLQGTTTLKRADLWLQNNPVGSALERIKETAIINPKDILFIKFEHFCRHPNSTMKSVYEYLEIPSFEHDFENIHQLTKEDDKWHGIYGDHQIRKKLTEVEPKAEIILGKEVCDYIYNNNKWFFDYFQYPY